MPQSHSAARAISKHMPRSLLLASSSPMDVFGDRADLKSMHSTVLNLSVLLEHAPSRCRHDALVNSSHLPKHLIHCVLRR